MASCRFCGDKVGMFRRAHKECEIGAKHLEGRASDAAGSQSAADHFSEELLKSSLLPRVRQAIVDTGFERAVAGTLEDGVISDEEHTALQVYRDRFGVTPGHMEQDINNGIILRHVLEGDVDALTVNAVGADLPFNFMKSEKLVWVQGGVGYGKTVTRREFKGGSTGYSVRVAKGVYLRQSAFKGRPVSTSSLELVDSGIFGVTTKHIYFAGGQERFRVRHDKVVAYDQYEDGIGIMRDGARAKPELFTGLDGWFAYNLLRNLG